MIIRKLYISFLLVTFAFSARPLQAAQPQKRGVGSYVAAIGIGAATLATLHLLRKAASVQLNDYLDHRKTSDERHEAIGRAQTNHDRFIEEQNSKKKDLDARNAQYREMASILDQSPFEGDLGGQIEGFKKLQATRYNTPNGSEDKRAAEEVYADEVRHACDRIERQSCFSSINVDKPIIPDNPHQQHKDFSLYNMKQATYAGEYYTQYTKDSTSRAKLDIHYVSSSRTASAAGERDDSLEKARTFKRDLAHNREFLQAKIAQMVKKLRNDEDRTADMQRTFPEAQIRTQKEKAEAHAQAISAKRKCYAYCGAGIAALGGAAFGLRLVFGSKKVRA